MTGPARTNTAAAEVLRKHRLVWYPDGASGCDCEALYSGSHEQHQADVLARAGLLADPTTRTEVEWGVACPLDDDIIPTADPDWSVRHHDRNCGPGHRLVRRTVTDWTPAEDHIERAGGEE